MFVLTPNEINPILRNHQVMISNIHFSLRYCAKPAGFFFILFFFLQLCLLFDSALHLIARVQYSSIFSILYTDRTLLLLGHNFAAVQVVNYGVTPPHFFAFLSFFLARGVWRRNMAVCSCLIRTER